jgi:tripartite-type tricarboxylate transporter receptor subunit TctC
MLGFAAMFALCCIGRVEAQTYPDRQITLICAFEPGGTTDTQARVLARKLTETIGQPVIVVNKAGGAGGVGMGEVARSRPDGYTVGITELSPMVTSPLLFKSLPYDPVKDFRAVVQTSEVPLVLVINPSIPANTLPELVKFLKENPNKYAYGTWGVGSLSHLSTELFKTRAGVKMTHVPYAGSMLALPDVLSGRVPIMFSVIAPAMQFIKGGKLKAIAVTSKQRNPLLPDVPTVAESGFPDFEAVTWYAVFLPAKTPDPIVEKLNSQFNLALKDPAVIESFQSLGMRPVGGTPESLAKLVISDKEKWATVAKDAGIKPLN